MNANNPRRTHTLTLGRITEAPRERVFQAWIEPEIMR